MVGTSAKRLGRRLEKWGSPGRSQTARLCHMARMAVIV